MSRFEDEKALFIHYIAEKKTPRPNEPKLKEYQELFDALRPYEIEMDCDVGEFSVYELRRLLSTMADAEQADLLKRSLMLSAYVNWHNGYINTLAADYNHIGEIEPASHYRNRMVKSPEDLMTRLNLMFAPSGFQTSDCVYRTYFWLAFAGIDSRDAGFVGSEHIFTQLDGSNFIRFEGDEYPLHKTGMVDVNAAATLTGFFEFKTYGNGAAMRYRINERQTGTELLRVRKLSGDFAVRDKPGANTEGIRPMIGRRRREVREGTLVAMPELFPKLDITYESVFNSGIFYRAYQQSQDGSPPDFSSVVDRIVRRRVYHDKNGGATKQIPRVRYYTLTALRLGYDMWRIAFFDS